MAKPNPTRRSHREERSQHEETLSENVDALQRQINTLAKRLSKAQAEKKRLRNALHDIEMNAENPVIRDMAEGALNGGCDQS